MLPRVKSSRVRHENIVKIEKELFLPAHADVQPPGVAHIYDVPNTAAGGKDEEDHGEDEVDLLLLRLTEHHVPVEHIDIPVSCDDDR